MFHFVVVFHDKSPRFDVLNQLAAWAKTDITENPWNFGVVNVEEKVELVRRFLFFLNDFEL